MNQEWIKEWHQEFEIEVKSTRKLIEALPEDGLSYRPSPTSWTMGELAQHIINIYHWFEGVFTLDRYDMALDPYKAPDAGELSTLMEQFEHNVKNARHVMQTMDPAFWDKDWTMTIGEKIIIGPRPRTLIVRNFLYSHLYHHRGEMIVYLRASGHKVPGLYGPTYEDFHQK